MTVAATAILTELVKQLTEKILSSKWTQDTEQGQSILEQLNKNHIAERYTKNYVSKQLRMRTLHSAERDVFLNDIYSPLRLTNKHSLSIEDEFTIKDDVTIKHDGVVNIIGIAGQGKSTILRKLFLEEIKLKDRMPIFIELRKVVNVDLISYIKSILTDIGVSIIEGDIEFLLQSNKTILMLDGFDEIEHGSRLKILNNIIQLNVRYQCPIIVTSRPDTEICTEVNVKNLHVKKLNKEEILSIIKKLDTTNSTQELPNIISNNENLLDTLVTPILVNLLYVCYPYLDSIPNNVVDFYHRLFITLYSRHDKIKNFNRERHSEISANEANEIFNAVSFKSIINDELDFSDESLSKSIQKSIKFLPCGEKNYDVEKIKRDLIEITCLIQSDGYDHYVYLHKSIAEFHGAKFISDQSSELKRKIYSRIVSNIVSDQTYDAMVSFLKCIDKKDFDSMFIVEFCDQHSFENIKFNPDEFYERIVPHIFKGKYVQFSVDISSKELVFNSIDSLHHDNVLSTIYLLENNTRHDGMVNVKLYEIMDELIDFKEHRDSPKYGKLDMDFDYLKGEFHKHFPDEKLNILSNKGRIIKKTNGDDIPGDTLDWSILRIRLDQFLTIIGNYDVMDEIIRSEINDFYFNRYVPIKDNLEKVSALIDFDLN